MATRSAIAIKHGRNTIKSVSCHWDGYPEHTEADFVEHYDEAGIEYYYLFDNGVWYVRDYRDVEWKEVESLLTKEKETA